MAFVSDPIFSTECELCGKETDIDMWGGSLCFDCIKNEQSDYCKSCGVKTYDNTWGKNRDL